MSQKRIDALGLVQEINIVHDFEELIKETIIKYKNSLGLPSISENDLINLLIEKKQDKLVKNLRTLINVRDLMRFKQWVDKTN